MIKNKEKAYGTVYTVARYWFLALFVGSVIDALLVSIFKFSFLVLSYRSWSCLFNGMILYHHTGMVEVLITFVIIAIIVSALYLLVFIFSKRRIGWFMAGVILYALDFISLVTYLGSIISGGEIIEGELLNCVIGLTVNALGLAFVIVALVFAKRLPQFARLGGNAAYDDAFSRVRMVSLQLNEYTYGVDTVVYSLNGRAMGELRPGKSRIIMIDGGYQRLTVSAEGTVSGEIVIPAGFDNPTYTVSRENADGVYKLFIYRV